MLFSFEVVNILLFLNSILSKRILGRILIQKKKKKLVIFNWSDEANAYSSAILQIPGFKSVPQIPLVVDNATVMNRFMGSIPENVDSIIPTEFTNNCRG